MTKDFIIKPHTMVFMVGPSCCGKSRMAEWLATKIRLNYGKHAVVISSDDCRRDLIGDSQMDNMHPTMMTVSSQAFALLDAKARAHMSFPVNTEFVFIDSTGLDHEMRKQYNILAKENGYNTMMLVFDLDREELLANVKERNGLEFVTLRHQKALKERVMPALDRKYWDDVIIIKSRAQALEMVDNFTIDHSLAHCHFWVPEGATFAVIGDVHERVEELQELIAKLPETVRRLFFIGDVFDKGRNTFMMIDFMNELIQTHDVTILKGNHENYITRRLTGEIDPNPEIEASFMTAVKPLLENEEYRAKFMDLAEIMIPFAHIHRQDQKDVLLTHAPVKNKYIGKTSKNALKAQINFRFESREMEFMQKELDFVKEESHKNHPWHVFGHVAHDESQPFLQGNKVWLDTGCVHGNRLSAIIFEGDRFKLVSVASKMEDRDPKLFTFKRAFDIEDLLQSEVRLSEEEERTANKVSKGGCKFISGTMSPAPSVVKDGYLEIESLFEGLQYFADRGVKNLVLQPKFMGSRCQVYLYRGRPAECFATSRNGFKIKKKDVQAFIEGILLPMFESKIDFKDELILDGELMPWAALGKGLILKDFGYYGASLQHMIRKAVSDPVLASLENVNIDFSSKANHMVEFENQLTLYGSDEPIRYEAFSILSLDGVSQMKKSQWEQFTLVNHHECEVVDPTTASGIAAAKEFFDSRTFVLGHEGIVLKPDVFVPGVLPYMKVRNHEYLRLIYGYDYPDRLERLCRQKNVSGKAKMALKEYQMGMAMLEMPEHREKLITAFFGQIAKEKELDPRL